jgi:hypothetical protein
MEIIWPPLAFGYFTLFPPISVTWYSWIGGTQKGFEYGGKVKTNEKGISVFHPIAQL